MAGKVTAKAVCTRKAEQGDQVNLTFGPDYQDGRNAEWAATTPSLSVSMTVKGSVADSFEENGKYTLTFEPTKD